MDIENKTLEILDLVREKVLSPDEALPHILRLFSVVGQSEQLSCGRNITTCVFYKNGGKCSNLEYCKDQTT
jgi:hypothetical protein